MKYDHMFMCQIFRLHHNKGRNGLHFGNFEVRKNALYPVFSPFPQHNEFPVIFSF
jgi:hypothetical protein